jgi:hypothetical protein
LPYAAIPELVAAAVRVQTGCDLAVGSWSVEAEMGLVMFVFNLPVEPAESPPGVTPLAAGRGRGRGRAGRLEPPRMPSWRTWSPVPEGGVLPERDVPAERQRLRLVEDERESGSVPQ